MGAGIFGLCCAFACARRGAHVQVIDPRGVAAGSSGGPVGALSPHTPENWNPKKQFQLDSLLLAPGFWAEIAALSGLPTGYGQIGRLQPIETARGLELAHARAESAKELWAGVAEWRVTDMPGGFAPPSATGLYVHDTLSARIDPKRACQSLAAAIAALGGRVATGGEPSGSVIWATGHEGLAQLSHSFGRPMGNGVKGQALRLGFDAGAAPQIYADGLYLVPHEDGSLAVGSTSERDFDAPGTTDDALEALYARALKLCPVLADAPVIARWAGVRPRAKSRAPMLGPWPDRPGHFIANGGFKIGFGMAPLVAEVMADLVLTGNNAIPKGFRVEDNL
jgi:glycine/D-amino acid oxidase-like deaminating enzyme